jgi:microcystin-dependent protein
MDNYLGEIRIFPYGRIPSADGWVPCNGQVMQISQNTALFSLLSTYYGGDGTKTFLLPNLNGRTIIGYGIKQGTPQFEYGIGATGGSETVQLTISNMPVHNHYIFVKNSYDAMLPGTNFLGNPNIQTNSGQTPKNASGSLFYTKTPTGTATTLNSQTITPVGSGGAHENRMPFLALVYCIATKGIYPTRP